VIALRLRLRPRTGAQDLAWLRHSIDDVHDVYGFLLQSYVAADLDDPGRPLADPDRAAAVAGMMAQQGTPIVRVREGSIVLELAQLLDQTLGVQALVAVGLLFRKGPEIAAWPNRVRQAWYSSREEAVRAQQAYERLSGRTLVDVVEDGASPAPAPDDEDCVASDDPPATGEQTTARRASSRSRRSG
jgi:hypothetical protein